METRVFRYYVQAKGHYEPEDSFWSSGDGMIDGSGGIQSNSEYTIISIELGDISSGILDIRVQAALGYYYTYHYGLSS